MPVIFDEEKRMNIRISLLKNGFKLIKKYGMKKTSIEEIAKSCGIAKGTFYNFFSSKEEFVSEIIQNKRNESKEHFRSLLDKNGYMERKEVRQYLEHMVDPENNLYLYLTAEDLAVLGARFPKGIIPKDENVMTTTTLLLDCIKERSPSCDWRVLANYIKIMALVSLNKDKVIKEALSVNLSGILDLTMEEIYGKD